MSNACPISYEKIDATIVRLNSISISILLLLFIMSGEVLFVYLLLADVLIRILRKNRFSPILLISKAIQTRFKLKAKNEDAAAKRFTLYLALGFSLIVVIFVLASYHVFASIVAIIFVICSSTEALFGYCIGCKMYQIGMSISEAGR